MNFVYVAAKELLAMLVMMIIIWWYKRCKFNCNEYNAKTSII